MNEPWSDARRPATAASTARSGPAVVRRVRHAGQIELAFEGDDLGAEAGLAVAGYAPRIGDRVLAFTDDSGAVWVIGVMSASPLLDEALQQAEAAPARVVDRRGQLLFEYDPATDRATLHAAAGDLELCVPAGALRMSARDGVHLESDASVQLRAGRELELVAQRDAGEASRVRLQPGELSLAGSIVTLAAGRAELLAERVGLRAQQLESHVERARHVAKVVDVRAGRIVERAVDVYREVERVSQTRAGRLKLIAKKAAQIVGETTLIKARDRVKIKGERIHLA